MAKNDKLVMFGAACFVFKIYAMALNTFQLDLSEVFVTPWVQVS
jgi:hypothetical protein